MTTSSGSTLRPDVLAYYERGGESTRLREGAGRLEFWRTRDVLRRLLPDVPARVLDVGGGDGVHARWLAADGHDVELVDPVPLHVARASALDGVTARLGDARDLPVPDASADVVLLLGPLYHLPERADRVKTLVEARRVVRPGGLVVAATINRFACVHDTLVSGRWFDPAVRARNGRSSATGRHSPEGREALFTTAYFHHPEEVTDEFADAGLEPYGPPGQYGVEGAAWLMGEVEAWLDDPARREVVMDALRRAESVPSLLGVSGHLLTAGRRRA